MLGNQFLISDASLVQQNCKQKLACEMMKKSKARSLEILGDWLEPSFKSYHYALYYVQQQIINVFVLEHRTTFINVL